MSDPKAAFVPAVAHICHYTDGDAVCRAAMVTGMGYHDGEVDLVVFYPDRVGYETRIMQSSFSQPGTWHWPDR